MSANKKPRKKYRPRAVIPDPVKYVLSGFTRPATEQIRNIKLINHGALLALTSGSGTKEDWEFICTALNAAVVLAERDIGYEYLDDIRAGMQAHAECGKRLCQHGRLGYTGQQLTAVNLAIEVHDAQIDIATVGELERAHMEVARRLRSGKIDYRVKEAA
jgi:hypothetical protein